MAWGNRPTFGQKIREYIEFAPDPFPHLAKSIFRSALVKKMQANTWLKCGHKYNAPIWPLRVYFVSPNGIKYVSNINRGRYDSDVLSGNWDQSQNEFEEKRVYRSFVQFFEENKSWEDTEYFEHFYNKPDMKYTNEELRNAADNYRQLYENIRKYGLITQRELEESKHLIKEIHDVAFYPPELREITVDVGRSGEILFGAGGQHRLSIAKILELDSIPVRIRLRHEKWQQKRDKIWAKPNKYDPKEITHPDLLPLFNKPESMS